MARLTTLLLLSVVILAGSHRLLADVTGTIQGTVTDQSGAAAVVGASVTLRDAATELSRTIKADAEGYQFLTVPIGEGYVVEVRAAGFETAIQTSIKLLVNQNFRADFQLKVGATTETVTTLAGVMQVETTSTQLGDVIEDTKMVQMPLNGRSYIDLLGLQAGVVPQTSGASMNMYRVSGNDFEDMVSVNGARETGDGYMVNGGDVEDSFQNGASVAPTLDSIRSSVF